MLFGVTSTSSSEPMNSAIFLRLGQIYKDLGLQKRAEAQFRHVIAIDPSNPKNVWVGTGESWTRNSVSVGNGVYRSTDGGETWSHLGLPESERIAKIIVHPNDGNTAWVCAPGKLWSDSDERGLFKTGDAGKTWTKVNTGLPSEELGRIGLSLIFIISGWAKIAGYAGT